MGYTGQDNMSGSGASASAKPFGGNGPAVAVCASSAHLAALEKQAHALARILVVPCPLGLSENIDTSSVAKASVLVLEVNPGDRASIDRLIRLRKVAPAVAVIAAVENPDLTLTRTLVREGVTDVIALPMRADELVTAVLDAMARHAQAIVPVTLAPVIGVVRSSGGCGATTVATHLAHALNQFSWANGPAILADLDLQFGEVAAYLDGNRSGSITDLMLARDRIDREFLQSMASPGSSGLGVLAAPETINSIESANVDDLLHVIEQLRRNYGVVVLDFPSAWTNWAASLAVLADTLVLVTPLGLSGLRQTRRTLDLFKTLEIADEKIAVVANRVERKMFRLIGTGEAETAIGRPFVASLPDEGAQMLRAQEQGVLIDGIQKKTGFSAAITKLAQSLSAQLQFGQS